MNPDLKDYEISEALKIRYDEFLRPKVAKKEKRLLELANDLKKELQVPETPPSCNAKK